MGLIDDIAAKYAHDPEFTRVFEESYQEGVRSAWSALRSGESQNVGTASSVYYPAFSATNESPKLKSTPAPA